MTIETPLWMQGIAGVPGFPARNDRLLLAQLWDEGVMDLLAFKVSQRAAGANFTVDVSLGEAVVQGDDQANQGNYLCRCTAIENATVTAAPGSNSRYDIVCLKISDPNAGGPAGSTATIVVTAGTVAASPSVPVAPASSLLLAVIGPIVPGTASITNSLITDARILAGRRCQPGTFEQTANSVAPNGWLLCYGQAVSRAVYARLFAHIGTAFGVGDGSTTFNLPDLRGRVGVGLDNMGGVDAGRLTAANTLGLTGGEELHALTTAELAAHAHANTLGNNNVDHSHHLSFVSSYKGDAAGSSFNHTHGPGALTHFVVESFPGPNAFGISGGTGATISAIQTTGNPQPAAGFSDFGNHNHDVTGDTAGASVPHTHAITNANAGGGAAHNNMQPYVLVNVLIRT